MTIFPLYFPDMKSHGYSQADYNVMERSCNSFTLELAKRMELEHRYTGKSSKVALGSAFDLYIAQ